MASQQGSRGHRTLSWYTISSAKMLLVGDSHLAQHGLEAIHDADHRRYPAEHHLWRLLSEWPDGIGESRAKLS